VTLNAEVLPVGKVLPFVTPERAEPSPSIMAAPPLQSLSFGPLPGHAPTIEPEVMLPKTLEPPAMIGPLARGEVEKPKAPEVTEAAPAATHIPPEEEQVELSIERFSGISAEIAEGRAARAEVLRRHHLTERAWRANEQRWTKALDQERANGSSRIRTASDRAYVEAVESFRGPITLPEYARIAIGLERGSTKEVLDDLRIQQPALMRIVRLWTRKIATDTKLGEEMRALLAEMRGS
jgi:hypothetical protein